MSIHEFLRHAENVTLPTEPWRTSPEARKALLDRTTPAEQVAVLAMAHEILPKHFPAVHPTTLLKAIKGENAMCVHMNEAATCAERCHCGHECREHGYEGCERCECDGIGGDP